MFNKRLVLIGIALFCAVKILPVYAFNSQKCDETNGKLYRSVGPFGLFTSSSQFSSSWGGCALIGMREQREVFIANNQDFIMRDSARGDGEYLAAVAELSGCHDNATRTQFSASVQKNFEAIYFNGNNTATPEQVGARIEKVIMSQPELKRMCKVTS